MAQMPHLVNLTIRPHQPESWRWQHDWVENRHQYRGTVTIRLRRAHPGPPGGVPITMQTVLTLDLGNNNPFSQPPPPPPPQTEGDLMDIDLPEDFIFYDPAEDSDHESSRNPVPLPSPFLEIIEDTSSSSGEVDMSDSDQWVDEPIGEDELMSDLDAEEEEDPEEDEEMESSEEEDPEEDEEMEESEEEDPEEESVGDSEESQA